MQNNRENVIRGAYLLAAFWLIADIATKVAVVSSFPLGAKYPVFSIFNMVHVRNEGAAFSFLHDAGGWQRSFFVVIGLIASVALAHWIRKSSTPTMERLAYASILGGALGNVLDRLICGAVVDWLDFHWNGYHWPAFNIADIGISMGAILLLIRAFGKEERRSAS